MEEEAPLPPPEKTAEGQVLDILERAHTSDGLTGALNRAAEYLVHGEVSTQQYMRILAETAGKAHSLMGMTLAEHDINKPQAQLEHQTLVQLGNACRTDIAILMAERETETSRTDMNN